MPNYDFGRSFTWPTEAITSNCRPKYFLIVFALEGDSTITSDFVFAADFFPARRTVPLPAPLVAAPFSLGTASFSRLFFFRDSVFFFTALANRSLSFVLWFPYILT